MGQQPASLNEWVCLSLLAEKPSHGFALAKQLTPESDLGRILTVRRPLVYRALDRVVSLGLAEPQQVEPGASGPSRTVHRVTGSGRRAVGAWLETPVNHVRDLRVEFLVKLRLLERRQLSAENLIERQRAALGQTLQGLIEAGETVPSGDGGSRDTTSGDVVDLWRANNARAVSGFLDQLQTGSEPNI